MAVAAPLPAQDSVVPEPTFQDILSLHDIGTAVISPDGREIAYTATAADWEENRYDTEIRLVRDGTEPFQLTRALDGTSTNPEWSPDGRWLAFIADRGPERQLYLIRPDGGEPWALAEGEEGVNDFAWTPGSRHIAFTRTEEEDKTDKQRQKQYGEHAIEDVEHRLRHLCKVGVPEEPRVPEATRLTEGDEYTVSGFAWSPDGSSIAFERRPDRSINS